MAVSRLKLTRGNENENGDLLTPRHNWLGLRVLLSIRGTVDVLDSNML